MITEGELIEIEKTARKLFVHAQQKWDDSPDDQEPMWTIEALNLEDDFQRLVDELRRLRA